MQFIDTLENLVRDYMAKAPHLSDGFRKGIANNLWWIIGITAVILMIYALYLVFAGLFWGLVSAFTFNFGGIFAVGEIWVRALFCGLMAFIAGAAVRPLQNMTDKGWRVLFLLWLFFAVLEILSLIANFSIGNLLWTAFYIVFFAYAIYEPRDYFFRNKAARKAAGAEVGAKKSKNSKA